MSIGNSTVQHSEAGADPSSGPPNEVIEAPTLLAVRAQLFLSSFLPLFVILAVRFDGTALKAACASLAALGALDLFVVFALIARRTEPQHLYVESLDDASGEVAGYLATYLLPFVTLTAPSVADLVGYCIFFAVLLSVFLRSNMAQVNPTLYLLGYRVAAVSIGGVPHYLVCRRLPRVPRAVAVIPAAGLLIRT